ncbi:hypothetical protein AMS68_002675 [Peltaster fructicola]|uniref:Uncharacterized protein n=1 Tax=Peltaster fructicola TaxID=286661 RepID=A0A6H0XR91_9PEZI|nr:hypothetical protein AMS68_002675 [Peltaster fructicola]
MYHSHTSPIDHSFLRLAEKILFSSDIWSTHQGDIPGLELYPYEQGSWMLSLNSSSTRPPRSDIIVFDQSEPPGATGNTQNNRIDI